MILIKVSTLPVAYVLSLNLIFRSPLVKNKGFHRFYGTYQATAGLRFPVRNDQKIAKNEIFSKN